MVRDQLGSAATPRTGLDPTFDVDAPPRVASHAVAAAPGIAGVGNTTRVATTWKPKLCSGSRQGQSLTALEIASDDDSATNSN